MGGEKHEGSDEPDIGRKSHLCQVRISKTAGKKSNFQLKTQIFTSTCKLQISLVQSSSCNVTKHTTQSKHRASPRITIPQTRRHVISCRAKLWKRSVPLSSNITHPQSNALRFTVSQRAAMAGRGCVPNECNWLAHTCLFFPSKQV